jgi:DNA invertase Pin-like site-specific DNA recombinase
MTIAAYIREKENDQPEIENWLQSRGIDRYQVEWFGDKKSDTMFNRPGFDSLQQAINNGRVKCVILWKVDRLSRRLRDIVNILADWAQQGLTLVVASQQLEIDGSDGRKIATLLKGLAETEQAFRKERQEAGIAVARKNGTYKGRKKGTTKIRPERARQLKESGLSPAAIATELGISKRTVFRHCRQGIELKGNGRTEQEPAANGIS